MDFYSHGYWGKSRYLLPPIQLASLNDFENGQVVLYPNPAQNVINIKNSIGDKTIRIFDINGRLVQQKKTASNALSITKLNQGFYFLEINGQIKKFIKK